MVLDLSMRPHIRLWLYAREPEVFISHCVPTALLLSCKRINHETMQLWLQIHCIVVRARWSRLGVVFISQKRLQPLWNNTQKLQIEVLRSRVDVLSSRKSADLFLALHDTFQSLNALPRLEKFTVKADSDVGLGMTGAMIQQLRQYCSDFLELGVDTQYYDKWEGCTIIISGLALHKHNSYERSTPALGTLKLLVGSRYITASA